jgi:hypothetical protein
MGGCIGEMVIAVFVCHMLFVIGGATYNKDVEQCITRSLFIHMSLCCLDMCTAAQVNVLLLIIFNSAVMKSLCCLEIFNTANVLFQLMMTIGFCCPILLFVPAARYSCSLVKNNNNNNNKIYI